MILAIDTSAGQCAVALADGAREWSKAETMDRGHAERLFPMIEEVLADAGAQPVDLTRIAVCTGPGSFTGLRVGVAAARGMASALGIPAIGVTRFEAVAEPDEAQIRLPARGGVVYVQAMDGGRPTGAPEIAQGTAQDRLPEPVRIARLAETRQQGPRPQPLYLRAANADPSKDTPPPRIE